MMRTLVPLLLILTTAACGGEAPQAPASDGTVAMSGNVRVDGSSTVFPISEAVAEEFRAVEPDIRVTVGVSGTGGGFKKFINNEVDINAASRPVKESELELLNANNIGFIELPVAFDGLSVVVNQENDWVDYLTIDELNMIWKPESTVTTWQDVRAEWPAEEIKLYGPGTDSGTFDYFTKTVNGKEQASRPDFTASEDDNVLVQGISGDLYSLGYFGYAYYIESKDKLKVVPIDGGTGPKVPTPETINSGTYKPLSRPVYIYVKIAALDKPQVAAFIDFYLEQAGTLASEVGYIPLPDAIYATARQRVIDRAGGSSYYGEIENMIGGK